MTQSARKTQAARHTPRRLLGPGGAFPVAYLESEACWLNLAGDYSYMESGYYLSQDMEAEGKPCHPTCKEALDAYVAPLFLEKARLAGLPVPKFYVTNEFFEPPVIIDPINPFMFRASVVMKLGHVERMARSLTRNFTYSICCQELPADARIARFRAVLGWSARPEFKEAAAALWETFRIPLATVRVVLPPGGRVLLSGVDVLPLGALTPRERARPRSMVSWPA